MITKLTVSYQQTENLGDYSNVKPSVTLEIALTEDDNIDFETRLAEAQERVRRAVEREVDDALEDHGKPARYSMEPRYALFTRYQKVRDSGLRDVAVIGPIDAAYPGMSRSYKNFRLPAIRRIAAEHYQDYWLIDTLLEPDALTPVLAQIAAEDALLEAERQRKDQEYQERLRQEQRRYAEQAKRAPADEDDDDEEDDD